MCELLDVSNPGLLKSALLSLIDANEQLQSLRSCLPMSSGDSLRQTIADIQREHNELLREREEVAELLNSQSVVPTITEILEELEDASALFSRLLGILSGNPMRITFPLSKPIQERLVHLVSDFGERMSDAQLQIESVMSHALSLGFHGSGLQEAVDFIAAAFVDAERQKQCERIHQDMIDIRSMSERERAIAERQRGEAKQRISDLRSALSTIQERAATREEELSADLESAQRKLREATDQLQTERRIHEELMSVIGGKVTDNDFLRSRLSEREMKDIAQAQQDQRRPDLSRRNRQDTLRTSPG
jgi:arsenate reductase-like glutaredoxin family protein